MADADPCRRGADIEAINASERHGKAMSIWGMGVMVGPIMDA